MKKLLILICIFVSISFFCGCNRKSNTGIETTPSSSSSSSSSTSTSSSSSSSSSSTSAAASTPSEEKLVIKDFFPVKENVKYTYEGKGNEFASFTMYIDYTSDDKIQQRVSTGGTETVKVIELKDGQITQVFTRSEAYYRENFLKAAPNDDEILLMEPIKKGTTWKLKDSSTRTITNTSAEIKTPAGSYKAVEVTTEGKNNKRIDYYANDVGLVESVIKQVNSEISSTLKKMDENSPFVQKVNFYYPNLNDEKIYFEGKEVSFRTNDITKSVLEKAYKEIKNEKFQKAFTTNTKINSLYLSKDSIVNLDLSKDFTTEVNAGAMFEQMILQSIANTFGHYYNAQKVIVTIDGKLYESGHILMKKGEFIKVSDKNTVEIKK